MKTMQKIDLTDLMEIEYRLLKLKDEKTFELDLQEVYVLQTLLDEISKITSLVFELQDAYAVKYKDILKLSEYHDKLLRSQVEYDSDKALIFITSINTKYQWNY